MDKVRWEIKDGQLVKEAFDPNGVEGFSHVQEHRACQSPLAEIPGYSFNKAGQLQVRAMPGSKPKLFIPQQPTLANSYNILLSRIFLNNLPIVSNRLMGR